MAAWASGKYSEPCEKHQPESFAEKQEPDDEEHDDAAERDDAARDEGERTGYHITTSTDHLTISSANP